MAAPILIIEDDKNTARLVQTYLEREGFATLLAHDGKTGLEIARRQKPLFVILDLMLPGLDGWEICRRLRKETNVPILMLTARQEEIDRIMGLSLGADDYVVKPFSPRELVERVKAILRRFRPDEISENGVLRVADLSLDPEKHTVTLADRPIHLTSSEFKLLHTLLSSPGRVFSRDELLSRFYQHGETVVDRVIDVHIGKLRQKIEENPAQPQYILTIRGFGYKIRDEG